MDNLTSLFEGHFGFQPASVEKLAGAGSNRAYYRLRGGAYSAVGVVGESACENRAFIALSAHFAGKQLPVPKVFAHSADFRYYLQEDLGDLSLFQAIEGGRNSGSFSEEEKTLLFKTIEMLPRIQFEGADRLDFSVCYPQPQFDRNTVMWDLNYFKYCFLKPSGVDFFEPDLERDFVRLADDLLADSGQVFLYRDFQSRNVMIKDGEPYFIDFQGGRRGAVYYDVASFVWQAKANFPPELKKELVERYYKTLSEYTRIDRTLFDRQLMLYVFFRTLQVLGAYGYRGYFERKQHFLESIPFAVGNLKSLPDIAGAYPHLRSVLESLCALPQFAGKHFDTSRLTVSIYSFSFKKGIPADSSGNGGGYVFDCRGIHNPGRYDGYKALTGLDRPVMDFLESQGEITQFLTEIYRLAEAHTENYLERGFSHLMFSFGCTGGQHRSVYSARHLAEYLHRKYGIRIELTHREQGISQVFERA